MIKVLFLTQTLGYKAACGMGLIGESLGSALKTHPDYEVEVLYTDDFNEAITAIEIFHPNIVFGNYCAFTTPWMNGFEFEKRFPNIKFVAINHETVAENAANFKERIPWNYLVVPDRSVTETENIFTIDRLLPAEPTVSYQETNIPIIGFQGFGARHKGIHKIAYQVAQEFDEAVINLHIPWGFFGDPEGYDARTRVEEVKNIVASKPGIIVNVSHDLLSKQEIVNRLAQNTINCYFNDPLPGNGLASSPDYALAANRPIAVTRSHQLKHFWDLKPSVLIEESSLKEIISNGIKPIEELRQKSSKENFLNHFSRIISKVLNIDEKSYISKTIIENNSNNFAQKLRFKFNDCEKLYRNFSQAGQDLFVLATLNGKRNGTYLEIGAGPCSEGNNSYLLETEFNWRGVSVEIDKGYYEDHIKHRKHYVELADATKVNFIDLLHKGGIYDTVIDYVSLDLDSVYTLTALYNLPLETHKFAVITYEHDCYVNGPKYKNLSRQYLSDMGYKLIVSNIAATNTISSTYGDFEDWWVHPELVDYEKINAMTSVDDSVKQCDDYIFIA